MRFPAREKKTPTINGYNIKLLPSFLGICFMITGISKSRMPKSFKPITITKEAKRSIKYAPPIEINTLPVTAHKIPMIENITAEPNMKKKSWMAVLNAFCLENPRIYPIIKGITASEQGDIEATTPPKKDIRNNIGVFAPVENKLA